MYPYDSTSDISCSFSGSPSWKSYLSCRLHRSWSQWPIERPTQLSSYCIRPVVDATHDLPWFHGLCKIKGPISAIIKRYLYSDTATYRHHVTIYNLVFPHSCKEKMNLFPTWGQLIEKFICAARIQECIWGNDFYSNRNQYPNAALHESANPDCSSLTNDWTLYVLHLQKGAAQPWCP